MATTKYSLFQEEVRRYYNQHKRDLPWRLPALKVRPDTSLDPYAILVSEIMLQQTQVGRVIPKYAAFLKQFPNLYDLAKAPLADVLIAWSGLGYNRRAKYLHAASQQLCTMPEPWKLETLVACPGVGYNTAAAVLNYAYNQPLPFIETNIRTAYIHYFFADQTAVTDKAILAIIMKTLDYAHPRKWHWALMDYGTHIKATAGNYARLSKHHTRQSAFEGSKRQLRGKVLRLLADGSYSKQKLMDMLQDPRAETVLTDMASEGFIQEYKGKLRLYYK